MKKRFFILLLLFPAFFQLVSAQEIQPKAIIDSTHILIGDQIKLHLELKQPAGLKVDFPVLGDSINSSIRIVSRSPLDTFKLDKKDELQIIQNYIITAFDTGKQVVPAAKFILHRDGKTDTLLSNEAKFFVVPMKLDTTKGPVDIKYPYSAPLTLKEIAPYILGAILIGAIIFFLFYYIKRKKKNKPVFSKPAKPKEPAHIIALRKLDQIKDAKEWHTPDKIKHYYSEISDTLRTYIMDRYEINALEYTSEEIFQAFQQKKVLSDKAFAELKNILSLSDLVKFAKYIPSEEDHNLSLMNSYFFINETKKDEIKAPKPPKDDRDGEEVDLK